MKQIIVHILNAFTHQGRGGNPAGVVTNADHLTPQQKQSIAAKVGLSETAFVSSSKTATKTVEFFTPNSQIGLCGHATIATWSLLKQQEKLTPGIYTQELKVGALEINIDQDLIIMEQALPKFGQTIQPSQIAPLINLDQEHFSLKPLPQFVSTGFFDLMVKVADLESLNNINPNFEKITQFQKMHNNAGLHIFTLETNSQAIATSRNFCPLLDISEESATGSATGALLCYLFHHKLITAKQAIKGLWFEQGYGMDQPSDIFGKLSINKNNQITKVEIGGKATILDTRTITLE